MEIPADTPYGITGEFRMHLISDGVDVEAYGTFSSIVPMPGVLGMFGLAGLLSTRRRHREDALQLLAPDEPESQPRSRCASA